MIVFSKFGPGSGVISVLAPLVQIIWIWVILLWSRIQLHNTAPHASGHRSRGEFIFRSEAVQEARRSVGVWG